MDSREYNAKEIKSVREIQIPYDLTHMWNLRNKSNEQRKKRQTKKQTLNYRAQTNSYQRGGGGEWVKQEMGMKEGTFDEHQVTYGSAESLYCAPESNITLYVNYTHIPKMK